MPNEMSFSSLRKNIIRIAVSLVVLVIAFWWAFQKIDAKALGQAFLTANYGIALWVIPIVILSHLMRAIRWKTLLSKVSNNTKIYNLFSAVMVGYAANNIIPRSGEILRPFVFSKREKLPFTTITASVIVERFIDVLNLLIFLSIAFYFIGSELQSILPAEYNISINSVMKSIGLMTFLLMVILIVFTTTTLGEWVIQKLFSRLQTERFSKIQQGMATFKNGLSILSSPQNYIRVIIESLSIWVLYILPMYVMLFAFNFTTTHQFTFLDSCVILLVMAIGTTIAPTPGAIGVVHACVTATMTQLYGVSKEEALAYTTLSHGLNYISVTIVGGLFMLRENVSLKNTSTPDS
ncbi:MAG: lysylphosphatidylglycerol synthase transmembrane domain-containing protein [Candidatus Kapaibacterium sp.]|nr:flippase-like domain-containing protein [Bacteroidota bacterium]